jgi:hypothetical protein
VIDVPAGTTAAANGVLAGSKTAGGRTIWRPHAIVQGLPQLDDTGRPPGRRLRDGLSVMPERAAGEQERRDRVRVGVPPRQAAELCAVDLDEHGVGGALARQNRGRAGGV